MKTSTEEILRMADTSGEEQSSFFVRFIMELLSPGGMAISLFLNSK